MVKEENKIVFFNTQADVEYAMKLSKIANNFSISNRKAMQLCLAECFGFISTPGTTRHKKGGGAKHFFLPFNEKEYIRVNTSIATMGRISFKTICKQSITNTYDLMFIKNKSIQPEYLKLYVEPTLSKNLNLTTDK